MLSTADNPFNPWTDYDKWDEWDKEHGYNTSSYIATIAQIIRAGGRVTDEEATDLAMLDILDLNITGNYVYYPSSEEEEEVEEVV